MEEDKKEQLKLRTYLTAINTITPDGKQEQYAGPKVLAFSQERAIKYLEATQMGYCKVIGSQEPPKFKDKDYIIRNELEQYPIYSFNPTNMSFTTVSKDHTGITVTLIPLFEEGRIERLLNRIAIQYGYLND